MIQGDHYEVNPDTDCWEWLRYKTTSGYGTVRRDGKSTTAHRWAYERENGPIPAGLEIDHLCRNRGCVNPDHLEAVTHTENMRRGRGTRITAEIARAIRDDYGTNVEIGARYGVHPTHVGQIKNGRRWATTEGSNED